jgi:hypothetical protein
MLPLFYTKRAMLELSETRIFGLKRESDSDRIITSEFLLSDNLNKRTKCK